MNTRFAWIAYGPNKAIVESCQVIHFVVPISSILEHNILINFTDQMFRAPFKGLLKQSDEFWFGCYVFFFSSLPLGLLIYVLSQFIGDFHSKALENTGWALINWNSTYKHFQNLNSNQNDIICRLLFWFSNGKHFYYFCNCKWLGAKNFTWIICKMIKQNARWDNADWIQSSLQSNWATRFNINDNNTSARAKVIEFFGTQFDILSGGKDHVDISTVNKV